MIYIHAQFLVLQVSDMTETWFYDISFPQEFLYCPGFRRRLDNYKILFHRQLFNDVFTSILVNGLQSKEQIRIFSKFSMYFCSFEEY